MEASQKQLLDQAAEIVRNANSQSWTAGLVALGLVVLFIMFIVMVRWFMSRDVKNTADGLAREQSLRAEMKDISDYTRVTLTDLVTKSTVAMNNVAEATRLCLGRQGEQKKIS